MEYETFNLIDQIQDEHWWFVGRKKIIKQLIEKFRNKKNMAIADVGSGFGVHIDILKEFGDITALEMNDDALDKIKIRWSSDNVKGIKWQSPDPLVDRFDLMLLADVLEHIPNDVEAAQWMWNHLNPGGQVLITVPAHQMLWSEMDDVCHHYRRYSKTQLQKLFAGRFNIKYLSYYNTTLFPVKLLFVIITRMLRTILPKRPKQSYNEVPPAFINRLFTKILCAEAEIMKKMSLPYGCSLVILAEKKL
jgi:SAM-dependent methyltransferase